MAKITVKHYLNTNLKPKQEGGRREYPIYVQVTYKRMNLRFKSQNNLFEYVTETVLNHEIVQEVLKRESEIIQTIITTLVEKDLESHITSKNLNNYIRPLGSVCEADLGKFITIEAQKNKVFYPTILEKLTYTDYTEMQSFSEIYGSLSEISNDVCLCITAIEYIHEYAYTEQLTVFDLYFKEGLSKVFNWLCDCNAGEVEETKGQIEALQKLAEI